MYPQQRLAASDLLASDPWLATPGSSSFCDIDARVRILGVQIAIARSGARIGFSLAPHPCIKHSVRIQKLPLRKQPII